MGVNIAEVDISNRGKHTKVKKKKWKAKRKAYQANTINPTNSQIFRLKKNTIFYLV
jgi:hypothetical protein